MLYQFNITMSQCYSGISSCFLNPELKTRINYDSKFGTHGKLALAVGELLNEIGEMNLLQLHHLNFVKPL